MAIRTTSARQALDRRRDRRREIDGRQVRAGRVARAGNLEQADVRARTDRHHDACHRGAVTRPDRRASARSRRVRRRAGRRASVLRAPRQRGELVEGDVDDGDANGVRARPPAAAGHTGAPPAPARDQTAAARSRRSGPARRRRRSRRRRGGRAWPRPPASSTVRAHPARSPAGRGTDRPLRCGRAATTTAAGGRRGAHDRPPSISVLGKRRGLVPFELPFVAHVPGSGGCGGGVRRGRDAHQRRWWSTPPPRSRPRCRWRPARRPWDRRRDARSASRRRTRASQVANQPKPASAAAAAALCSSFGATRISAPGEQPSAVGTSQPRSAWSCFVSTTSSIACSPSMNRSCACRNAVTRRALPCTCSSACAGTPIQPSFSRTTTRRSARAPNRRRAAAARTASPAASARWRCGTAPPPTARPPSRAPSIPASALEDVRQLAGADRRCRPVRPRCDRAAARQKAPR